jgi:peptidoglycan hydrolase-like protein with peptidoglycan-binding domain
MAMILKIHSKGPEVIKLQQLLNNYGITPPLVPDGDFGKMTEDAVRKFQATIGEKIDGIVGPVTWTALEVFTAQPSSVPTGTEIQPDNFENFCFPLASRPDPDWTGEARYFGAPRNGRLHAGCDLLGSSGTPIYSVSDGVLIQGPYRFTGPKNNLPVTEAVEIRHGGVLVRYGEIMPGSYVGGKTTRKGQVIAQIGALKMLHFELYKDGASAASLTGEGPYKRRADVTDPAPYLEKWIMNLP